MKRKLIIIMALSCSIFFVGCGTKKVEEQKPIAVSVQAINHQGIENTNKFTGTTKVKDETSVTVEMAGTIQEMYVSNGQEVKKGDKLLLIKGKDVENSIKQAKSALDLAQASYENTVENTDLTVANQKNQLETNLNVSKITFDEAKKNYDIYKQLVDSGALAENDNTYRQIVQAYEKSKESLESAQKSYDNGVNEGGKELAKKQLDQAKTSYDIAVSARNKLVLYSPVDGVITSKNFDVNEMVSQTQPAFIISNMDKIQVDLSVTQEDIEKFKKNETVKVTIDDKEYKGTINNVPSVVNNSNSLYTVEIILDNNGELKAGQTAEVELELQKSNDTIAVTKKAVLEEDGEKYVYVVSDDNRAVKTKVETGIETDSKIQILSGISKDDTIVIGGLSLISDDAKIFPVTKED